MYAGQVLSFRPTDEHEDLLFLSQKSYYDDGKAIRGGVSDCIANTDTTVLAHVLLPALGWSEKDGAVTNSERCISRQRALLSPAGSAKPDWWIITQVARRMGFEQAFHYQNASEIFREHTVLSGFDNNAAQGQRDFDISAFAEISQHDYDLLQPIQWPVNQAYPQGRVKWTPLSRQIFIEFKIESCTRLSK